MTGNARLILCGRPVSDSLGSAPRIKTATCSSESCETTANGVDGRLRGEYIETGWSGAKASRPQLDRLMKDAHQRRFDAVLVWKLDRWGRSLIQSLQASRS